MLEFDIELNRDNLQENIHKICPEFKPHWSGEPITIKHLSGGITNSLYACHLGSKKWNDSDTVLFRIFGLNTEEFISRTDEVTTMMLMKKFELGPQIYGRFKNGICYELLPGDILTQDDVYNEAIYTKVAEAMALMQFSKFDGFETTDPAKKDDLFIFAKLDKLFSLLKEDYKTTMPDMTNEVLERIPSKLQLKDECDFLKSYFIEYTTKRNSLIVFSHNDLLLGNIIFNRDSDCIKFIDYEYGQMNYQAYDIANHFNEFAGVDTVDYSFFPGKEFQKKWLKIYLNAFYKLVNKFYENEPEKQRTVNETMIEELYDEVNKFTAASNLIWSIWSFIQAQNSTIDFDFVEYGSTRYGRYLSDKKRLIQAAFYL